MKRHYMRPRMVVVEACAENMIATSPNGISVMPSEYSDEEQSNLANRNMWDEIW